MKLLLILSASILLNISAWSQMDIIYTMDNQELNVNITEVGETSVKYSYSGETMLNTISNASIDKIIFKSGREQSFRANLNVALVTSCLDWEKVQITNLESEIRGLMKLENVGAKAQGASFTSISKLEERAYKKTKIQAAMLGANTVYIMTQKAETAKNGWYNSSNPTATVTGLAYTSNKVSSKDITYGDYEIKEGYVLSTNAMELESVNVKKQTVSINLGNCVLENGSLKINLAIHNQPDLNEFTIISADDEGIVLSTVYMNKRGKKYHFNFFLKQV